MFQFFWIWSRANETAGAGVFRLSAATVCASEVKPAQSRCSLLLFLPWTPTTTTNCSEAHGGHAAKHTVVSCSIFLLHIPPQSRNPAFPGSSGPAVDSALHTHLGIRNPLAPLRITHDDLLAPASAQKLPSQFSAPSDPNEGAIWPYSAAFRPSRCSLTFPTPFTESKASQHRTCDE